MGFERWRFLLRPRVEIVQGWQTCGSRIIHENQNILLIAMKLYYFCIHLWKADSARQNILVGTGFESRSRLNFLLFFPFFLSDTWKAVDKLKKKILPQSSNRFSIKKLSGLNTSEQFSGPNRVHAETHEKPVINSSLHSESFFYIMYDIQMKIQK